MQRFFYFTSVIVLIALYTDAVSQKRNTIKLIPVDSGWSQNSVNTVPFRRNSLVTWKDTQYISFYNPDQQVVIGKREHGSETWTLQNTRLKGNATDAHNSISIIVDGDGLLHLAWDHHNNRLHYARETARGSLTFDTLSMTGIHEHSVTYPEFYRLRNGNLLFLYRDGGSGKGNLIVNTYDLKSRAWSRVHDNLIDGEGQRNAYWQAYVDVKGTIHISWVWRETPDVASNHDMCYARSKDNGKTWEKLSGEKYALPIKATSAEYALRIPQNSDLINQTSMAADRKGNPFIATYWKDSGSFSPRYRLIFARRKKWKYLAMESRQTPFALSGFGTKSIPIARPQVLVEGKGRQAKVILLFRDAERNNVPSIATIQRIRDEKFTITDLDLIDLGSWEPSYDTEAWKAKGSLQIFLQQVRQADAEGLTDIAPTMIYVLTVE